MADFTLQVSGDPAVVLDTNAFGLGMQVNANDARESLFALLLD